MYNSSFIEALTWYKNFDHGNCTLRKLGIFGSFQQLIFIADIVYPKLFNFTDKCFHVFSYIYFFVVLSMNAEDKIALCFRRNYRGNNCKFSLLNFSRLINLRLKKKILIKIRVATRPMRLSSTIGKRFK